MRAAAVTIAMLGVLIVGRGSLLAKSDSDKRTSVKRPAEKRPTAKRPATKRPAAKRPTAKAPAVTRPFKIIVHPAAATATLDRKLIADIFLKRTTFWPNGQAIRPVDLAPDAKARRAFSTRILNRPVSAVRTFWQQRIFTGRGVPPPELETDAAVVAYVRANPGAIGYVSGSAPTRMVKVVTVK